MNISSNDVEHSINNDILLNNEHYENKISQNIHLYDKIDNISSDVIIYSTNDDIDNNKLNI